MKITLKPILHRRPWFGMGWGMSDNGIAYAYAWAGPRQLLVTI